MGEPDREEGKTVMSGRSRLQQEWTSKDGLVQIEGWARDGLHDKQIAHNIGISERTFSEWKLKHSSILAAIKKGRAPVDIAVENAMLKSALGFKQSVRVPMKLKKVYYKDGKRYESEVIEYVDQENYYPPCTAAQIFWLKNRRKDKWKDKPETANVFVAEDDGFIKALNGTAEKDWKDEDGDIQV